MCSAGDDTTTNDDRGPYVPPHYPCPCRLCNCYARVPTRWLGGYTEPAVPCVRCQAGQHADRPRLPERARVDWSGGRPRQVADDRAIMAERRDRLTGSGSPIEPRPPTDIPF